MIQRDIYNWDGKKTVDMPDEDGNMIIYPTTDFFCYYSVGDGFLAKDYGWLLWED